MAYQIRPLDDAANTARFECGEPVLNTYLQRDATQDIKRRIAWVFNATPEDRQHEIAGSIP